MLDTLVKTLKNLSDLKVLTHCCNILAGFNFNDLRVSIVKSR